MQQRRTMPVRVTRLLGVLGVLGLLVVVVGGGTGCAAASRPVEIALREADTRRPVPDALVRIAGADIIDPASGTVLDPARSAAGEVVTGGSVRMRSGFTAVEGRTDVFGLLMLPAPTDAPFEVMVIRPGEPVRRVLLGGEEHPARRGVAGPWIDLDGPISEGRPGPGGLELQLRPTPY